MFCDETLFFRKEKHVELFLNYLKNQHKTIKFTKEIEEQNFINFYMLKFKK